MISPRIDRVQIRPLPLFRHTNDLQSPAIRTAVFDPVNRNADRHPFRHTARRLKFPQHRLRSLSDHHRSSQNPRCLHPPNEETKIEALIIRGYETKGYGGEIGFKFAPTAYGIAAADPFESETGLIRTLDNDIQFDTDPSEIKTIALYTAPYPNRHRDTPAKTKSIQVLTRSWNRNDGPPAGSDEALTVRINTPHPDPLRPRANHHLE